MRQRCVWRAGAAFLAAAAGSAKGQTTFSGNDLGRPFTFTGISSDQPGSAGAGVNDGSIGTRTDAFDGAAAVTVNGVALAAPSFFVTSSGDLFDFSQDLGGGLSATYTQAYRDDRAVVRIDVQLRNRNESPATFNVVINSNLGSDG
ncbi:MAG: hypothetical protein AAGF47_09015, partial [Planctomycetota bacterium]